MLEIGIHNFLVEYIVFEELCLNMYLTQGSRNEWRAFVRLGLLHIQTQLFKNNIFNRKIVNSNLCSNMIFYYEGTYLNISLIKLYIQTKNADFVYLYFL